MATISKSVTVSDGGTYTLELNAIPTGSTVTPVNDIQTWLHCADIWDKSYTTIAQVLNDASTLQALIASNNAVDYMARSTNWASSVAANVNAMSYIGANNYCTNKLLANGTWLNAICNSTYFESVLNVKVPTMTSNTTPSGEVSASGQLIPERAPWKAFNGSDTTNIDDSWHGDGTAGGANTWIQYMFPSAKRIYMAYLGNFLRISTFKIQASNNGSIWTDVSSVQTANGEESWKTYGKIILTTTTTYKYYRLLILTSSNNYEVIINRLQFYGRA